MTRFDLDGLLRAMENRDVPRMMGFFADDVEVYADDFPTPFRGKAALRGLAQLALPAVSELHMYQEYALQEGDQVATLVHVSATYDDDLTYEGVRFPLGGKTVEMNAAIFLRVNEAGKIGRLHRVRDNHSLLRQIGMDPAAYDSVAKRMLAAPR